MRRNAEPLPSFSPRVCAESQPPYQQELTTILQRNPRAFPVLPRPIPRRDEDSTFRIPVFPRIAARLRIWIDAT